MKLFNPMAGVAFAAAAALAQIAAITGVVTDPDTGAVKVALVERGIPPPAPPFGRPLRYGENTVWN
jgi:hypothetical protein